MATTLSEKITQTLTARTLMFKANTQTILQHLRPFTDAICIHLDRSVDTFDWIDVQANESQITLIGRLVKNDPVLLKKFGNIITISIPNEIIDARNLNLFLVYLNNLQHNAEVQHTAVLTELTKSLQKENEDIVLPPPEIKVTKH